MEVQEAEASMFCMFNIEDLNFVQSANTYDICVLCMGECCKCKPEMAELYGSVYHLK